jgi:hypothetical protein
MIRFEFNNVKNFFLLGHVHEPVRPHHVVVLDELLVDEFLFVLGRRVVVFLVRMEGEAGLASPRHLPSRKSGPTRNSFFLGRVLRSTGSAPFHILIKKNCFYYSITTEMFGRQNRGLKNEETFEYKPTLFLSLHGNKNK